MEITMATAFPIPLTSTTTTMGFKTRSSKMAIPPEIQTAMAFPIVSTSIAITTAFPIQLKQVELMLTTMVLSMALATRMAME